MEIHQVQVEQESLLPEVIQKIAGSHEDVLVGPCDRRDARRVTPEPGFGASLGRVVDVEALIEAEVRRDPAVAPDPDRPIARCREDQRVATT